VGEPLKRHVMRCIKCMPMKLINLTLLLIICALPVVAQDASSWKLVRACGVTFRLPSNVLSVRVSSTDSCVRWYRSNDLDVVLDVIYSPLTIRSEKLFHASDTDQPEFKITETKIAGVRALIKTYYKSTPSPDNIGLNYISKLMLSTLGADKRGLTMRVHGRESGGIVLAQRVFQSIALRPRKRA